MEINDLHKRSDKDQDKKLITRITYFQKLIEELNKKEIPAEIVNSINQYIEEVNTFDSSNKDLRKQISKSQSNIMKLLEKELKIVPKNIYRTRWMAISMAGFGIPMGMTFGVSLGNMAFIGIGIPIGMVLGIVIGAGMDNKALKEGRQLDVEIGG